MRIFWAFVFSFALSFQARGATIEISRGEGATPDFIYVYGELVDGDAESFKAVAEQSSNAIVALAGPGGNIADGLMIGEMIRLKNFATVVLDETACASACALAWLGGTRRFMGAKGMIGFHAAHDERSGSVSSMGNAVVGAYLNKLGLPLEAVMYITAAAPDQLFWLNQADAKRFSISFEVLAPEPTDRQTLQTARTPLDTEAIAFLNKHFQNQTRAISSAAVQDQYADLIFYYGKNMDRTAVLQEFETFIRRWPERSYKIRDDTIRLECFAPTQVCNISATIDWIAISRERRQRSEGYSNWGIGMLRRNGRFVITSVNGEVLKRRITDLTEEPVATQR
jgi:ATP-dependent protease ClpP protease subunit